MADGTLPFPWAQVDAFADGAIMVVIAGEHYALPLSAVEAITPPPALCRIPHAPPALLGAGNLAGQVLPIVDLAALLPGSRPSRPYDGAGEVLRVHAAGGSVGVWIDRVERLFQAGDVWTEAVVAIDPEPLIAAGLEAPELASDVCHPVGDARELADAQPVARTEVAYIAVATAGREVLLPQKAVLELTEPPPCVAVPGAPAGFYGIGILRGDAVPTMSLSVLLGLPESEPPGCFALMALAGHRLLLGFGRVVGLRTQEQRPAQSRADEVFDLATALSEELRDIVSGFAPAQAAQSSPAHDNRHDARQYLSFVVARQNYALPVEAVDRVVAPQPLVALPRHPGGQGRITGAIDLRGQVVPVASIDASADEPGAYVIMRAAGGPMAIGVERVDRLVSLRPEQLTPMRNEGALIDRVGLLAGEGDLLRILSPHRVEGG